MFQNKGDDHAFIIYDRDNPRILILVFDDLADKYYLLFKDMRVANGLESADCNYAAFGTLDYQIAEELIYKKEYLIKKPEGI